MGPTGLGQAGRLAPVAVLRDLFAVVQAQYVLLQGSCLVEFAEITGRPAWFRPPGSIFSQSLFEFLLNVGFTLLI